MSSGEDWEKKKKGGRTGVAFFSSTFIMFPQLLKGPLVRELPSSNFHLIIFKASVFQMSKLECIHQELSRNVHRDCYCLVLCIFLNILKYFIKLPEISRKILYMNIMYRF